MGEVSKRVVISDELNDQINEIAKERNLYPVDVIKQILEDYIISKKSGIDSVTLLRLNELTEAIKHLSYIIETNSDNTVTILESIANLNVGGSYLDDEDGESE